MNNPKSRVKYAKNLPLRVFKMSKTFFAMFSRSSQMFMKCSMQEAFWVTSKCGLMMVFVCFLRHRSSMLNQLSNLAPLCRFRRCAPCHLKESNPPMTRESPLDNRKMSRKSTFTSHHISGLPHWSQPKGSSNFCSVTRLQWFTLITRS